MVTRLFPRECVGANHLHPQHFVPCFELANLRHSDYCNRPFTMYTTASGSYGEECGYEDDDDGRVQSARSARRASLKMGRRSSAGGRGDAFASDYQAVKKKGRRASMSGTPHHMDHADAFLQPQGRPRARTHRRASFSGPVSPDKHAPRRGSASGTYQGHAAQRISAINPDALARMSRLEAASDSDTDDESNQYGYGVGGATYGYEPQPRSRMPRRASNASHASRASRASTRSRRRNSCIIRKDKDPMVMAEICAGPQLVPDSDLENSDSENETATGYGYGYGAPNNNPYGYEGNAPTPAGGYDSDANASRASSRSRRRNSCIIRKDKDPMIMAEIAAGPALVPDSDMDDDDDDDDDESGRRGGYGGYAAAYGAQPPAAHHPYGRAGYESDSTAGATIDTRKRSKRRNSCLNHQAAVDERDRSDLNDPDSLLSRSGFYNKDSPKDSMNNKVRSKDDDDEDDEENEQSGLFKMPDNLSPRKTPATAESRTLGADPNPSNTTIAPNPALDASFRSTPFTTSYTAPTAEQLGGSKSSKKMMDPLTQSLHSNWGEMDITSNPESSVESEESYGASMYETNDVYEEIDRYQQKARRRASMEASCMVIKPHLITPAPSNDNMTGEQVPNFKAAEGCSKASDFIVRCFAARLRSGIAVLKHNRSRFSKSQYRVLYLLPDGKTISWKPLENEKDKGKRPKLDLRKCVEVRHAWSADPATRKRQGTAVLRKNCKDGMAARSLSLVFGKRTLDMTALSNDLCKVLLEGFSALCFRLQMLEMAKKDASTEMNVNDMESDSNFASTVYGGQSTINVSMTLTSVSETGPAPETPWGL